MKTLEGNIRLRNLNDGKILCVNVDDDTTFFLDYDKLNFYFHGLDTQGMKNMYFLIENQSDVVVNTVRWTVNRPKIKLKSPLIINPEDALENQEDPLTRKMTDLVGLVDEIASEYIHSGGRTELAK